MLKVIQTIFRIFNMISRLHLLLCFFSQYLRFRLPPTSAPNHKQINNYIISQILIAVTTNTETPVTITIITLVLKAGGGGDVGGVD
jgi:hypothetical protein